MENLGNELNRYYANKVKNNLVKDTRITEVQPQKFDCDGAKVANMELKNKYVFANFTDAEFFDCGEVTRHFFDFYKKIAKSDVGLIFTGGVYGIYDLVGLHNVPVIFNNNKHKKQFIDFTQAIHTSGAKIMLTLKPNFGCCNDNAKLFNALLGSASFNKNYYDSRVICGRLSDQRCNEIANRFKGLSRFAKDCNFDGVLVDGGLDEVLGEFSSKEFNRRQLGYFAEIYDLPVKCVKSIVTEVGNYPIIYKFNLQTFFKDVYDDNLKQISTLKMINKFSLIEQVVDLLGRLVKAGVDVFFVRLGARETEFLSEHNSLETVGLFSDYFDLLTNTLDELDIKNKFGEKVKFVIDYDSFVSGNNNDYLCDITKNLYADKDFIIKQKTQKLIKKCIKCNKCVDFKQKYNRIECLINPELKDEIKHFQDKNCKENIAIVGGGVSGMVCALTLAKRGIKCDLFEQDNVLNKKGENCDVFGYDQSLKNYNDYLKCEILKNAKNNKINLKLCTKFEYDTNLIKNYTTIVVATGSHEKFLNSNGAVQKHVKSIYDVLSNKQHIAKVDTIAIYAKFKDSLSLSDIFNDSKCLHNFSVLWFLGANI